MRALIYDGQLRFGDAPDSASPGPDQARLRIHHAGICNTDMELMAGYMAFAGILGHEFVATVEEGPAEWQGRRVVSEINVACGKCDFCAAGIPSQCRDRHAIGINRYPGAFADTLVVPTANLHAVPDEVSDDAAVFAEPLAAALQVTEAIQVSPRDRVVVLGAGKLGLLVAQVLKLTGADLVVPVRREKQARLLEKWQIPAVDLASLPRQRAQVVVDCTGEESGFATSLDLVEPRGTIVLKSTYHGLPKADLTRVAVNEIRLVGSRCGPFDAALRLLARGLVDVESMIEGRYPLEDGVNAMQHAMQKGALKILLDINQRTPVA
jgi:threonine dehydrogenase-like Zn-dependent dehydrogenase